MINFFSHLTRVYLWLPYRQNKDLLQRQIAMFSLFFQYA